MCTAEAACCTSPGRTVDDCKLAIKTSCVNELYIDAISSNSITGYDASYAASAFAEFDKRAASCDVTIAPWAATVKGLRGIARGTRASGADCTAPNALTNRPEAAAYLAVEPRVVGVARDLDLADVDLTLPDPAPADPDAFTDLVERWGLGGSADRVLEAING